jgi:WD40 repeat protein
MQRQRTVPLLKNIYSTNAAIEVECEWVINHIKEIKWIKFSPDDRFLFVTDSRNVTLFDLNHRDIKCSISHENDVIGIRFPDDNCSFALISIASNEYGIRLYSYGGDLLASSDGILKKNYIPYPMGKAVIGNSTIAWIQGGGGNVNLVLNLYDYYNEHYVIKKLAIDMVGKGEKGYKPLSIYVRLEIKRIFVLMKDPDPGSQLGKAVIIDIDLHRVVNYVVIQEIGEVNQVSKCGGFLATYTRSGECWVYDLQCEKRSLILKYDRFLPARIIPLEKSSFLVTGPPEDNNDGYSLIIYDAVSNVITKQLRGLQYIYRNNEGIMRGVEPVAYFQITDDLKYLMGFTGDSLKIWDFRKLEVVGEYKGSQKLGIGTAKLSHLGNYLAITNSSELVYIFRREKLPKTMKTSLSELRITGFPYTGYNNYLLYRCEEMEKDSKKIHYYYKFLKLSESINIVEKAKQHICEKGAVKGTYRYYDYLGGTGYFICSDMNDRLRFYLIESGGEVLNIKVIGGFGFVYLSNIATSKTGNRIAALSSTGLIKIFDTSYLNLKNYSSSIPAPQCIRRIRANSLFEDRSAVLTHFISDERLFIGYSNGDIKILKIASRSTISQNRIDKIPGSIRIIKDNVFLIVSNRSSYIHEPIRLYLWNYIKNDIKPLRVLIDGEEVYDFDAFRLSTKLGILAVAVNKKGIYTINIERIGDIKKVGALGWVSNPGNRKLFGIFEILPEEQKLLIIDVASEEVDEPYPKKRIRIWDLFTGKPQFKVDTFLEEYNDIDIVSEKYIALWSKKDDLLKLYDLNLNLIIIEPIFNFSGFNPAEGIIKSWGDKVVVGGSDLNIYQII